MGSATRDVVFPIASYYTGGKIGGKAATDFPRFIPPEFQMPGSNWSGLLHRSHSPFSRGDRTTIVAGMSQGVRARKPGRSIDFWTAAHHKRDCNACLGHRARFSFSGLRPELKPINEKAKNKCLRSMARMPGPNSPLCGGEGMRLFTEDGTAYLDFAAGIAVNALGYGDKHVVDALKAQADKVWHTPTSHHPSRKSSAAAGDYNVWPTRCSHQFRRRGA